MELKKRSNILIQFQKHASILSAIFSFVGVVIYGTSFIQGRIMELDNRINQISTAQSSTDGDVVDLKKFTNDGLNKSETNLQKIEEQIDVSMNRLQDKIDKIYLMMAKEKDA